MNYLTLLIIMCLIAILAGCAGFQDSLHDPNSQISQIVNTTGAIAAASTAVAVVLPEPWSTVILLLSTVIGAGVAALKSHQLEQLRAKNKQDNAIDDKP